MSNIDFKTEDKKELVLKDIYSRLPYGVMVRVEVNDVFIKPTDEVATVNTISMFDYPQKFRVTPYLRPMSSMTKEEKVEYNSFNAPTAHRKVWVNRIDWLLSHHFDYRGLIPMGLALPATEGMYK